MPKLAAAVRYLTEKLSAGVEILPSKECLKDLALRRYPD